MRRPTIKPFAVPRGATERQKAIALFMNASLLYELRAADAENKLDELAAANHALTRAGEAVDLAILHLGAVLEVERVGELQERRERELDDNTGGVRIASREVA